MTKNLLELPPNLPVPEDDGACNHLEASLLPTVNLLSTSGQEVDLSKIVGTTVVYIFPMIGNPNCATHDWLESNTWRKRLHAAVMCVSRPTMMIFRHWGQQYTD